MGRWKTENYVKIGLDSSDEKLHRIRQKVGEFLLDGWHQSLSVHKHQHFNTLISKHIYYAKKGKPSKKELRHLFWLSRVEGYRRYLFHQGRNLKLKTRQSPVIFNLSLNKTWAFSKSFVFKRISEKQSRRYKIPLVSRMFSTNSVLWRISVDGRSKWTEEKSSVSKLLRPSLDEALHLCSGLNSSIV